MGGGGATNQIDLEDIFQLVARLTPEERARLVEFMQEEFDVSVTDEDEADEARWDELFAKSPHVLERLANEARADREAGRTRELDPDSL